jgi:hypothetical protein
MKTADLSVIVPNYNHAHYLPRALDAILGQSVLPKEILVVDDCSTDDSVQVIEGFARRNSLIRLIRNDRNLGCGMTVHRGLGLSTGAYLFSTAADDFILPGFIEQSMELLARHPRAGLSCAYLSTIDGVTGVIRPNPSNWCDRPSYLSPGEIASIIGPNCIPGHAAIYKRSSWLAAGGILQDLRWHWDWFLNLVIAFRDGICHIPETLALLTVLPTTYSAQGSRDAVAQREVLSALLSYLISDEYRDVAFFFQKSGVLRFFGADLIRAAATHPDRRQAPLLRLIDMLPPHEFEVLLHDDAAEVRALAAHCLRPLEYWAAGRRQPVEAELARANALNAAMRSSKFWRMRNAWMRCKGIFHTSASGRPRL